MTTGYTRTDDGNALNYIDTNRHRIRYCPQRGQWLTWTGHRWEWDDAGLTQEYAREMVRLMPADSNSDNAWKAKSMSHRGIRAMLALATTDQRIVVPLDKFDAQPYELNTPIGVVDLHTGRINPPDPNRLHTRTTTTTPMNRYKPDDAPMWERFLADTFAGEPALTSYVQRILGLSLIGTVLEQILPFAFGNGANGKSTLFGVAQRLVGIGESGYSISAPKELLIATAHEGHPTEIARLAGARMVVTSELEDDERFAEAKVKLLTGGDVLSGRFMHKDRFNFVPTHTLFVLANTENKPQVRTGGDAFWRRVALVPFMHKVPKEQRDVKLEDRLVEIEGPQILAWLIRGAVDYLAYGLATPESVQIATDAYAADQDTIGRFVDECCDIGRPNQQTFTISSSQLRGAYEKWCGQGGDKPVSAKAFATSLGSRYGVQLIRSSSARMFDGIRLKATEPEPEEPPRDRTEPMDPDFWADR